MYILITDLKTFLYFMTLWQCSLGIRPHET